MKSWTAPLVGTILWVALSGCSAASAFLAPQAQRATTVSADSAVAAASAGQAKLVLYEANGSVCSACNGTGKITCPVCKGVDLTTLVCTTCRGEDWTKQACPTCRGVDWTKQACPTCRGSGNSGGRSCYSCRGTGQRSRCYSCRGIGNRSRCYSCRGIGKRSRCYSCRGQAHGVCSTCIGGGHVESVIAVQDSTATKYPVAENSSYYGEISDLTGRPKVVFVRGYYRKDGTYVRSHYRSLPRSAKNIRGPPLYSSLRGGSYPGYKPFVAENGSYYGETSTLTGRPKTVHVRGYYRKDGTYVRGHYRSRPRRR